MVKNFTDFVVGPSVTNLFVIMQGRNGRNIGEKRVDGAEKVGRYLKDLSSDVCGI